MRLEITGARLARVWPRLICAALFSVMVIALVRPLRAQQPTATAVTSVPDLAGVWDGNARARPVNSETVPWGKDNFPSWNARALAYQQVFDEALAPKYDCQPASSPAIQVPSPYSMEVTQWPDRVLFRYEKDDQLRTVWLDGRMPTVDAEYPGSRWASMRMTRCSSTRITSFSISRALTTTTASPRHS